MSDPVIISLIGSITTTLGIIVVAYLNNRHAKVVSTKVDEYHKEVNGKMSELLDTTKALGIAEGQAKEKRNNKNK